MSTCLPAVTAFNSAHASVTTSLAGRETLFYALLGARQLFHETFFICPVSEPGDCFTPELLRYLNLSKVDVIFRSHCFLLRLIFNRHPQIKKKLPTALSDVVSHQGDKIIQSMPVWNVRVTLFCLGSIGALQNIHRFMR